MSHREIIDKIIDHWKYRDRAAFYCPYVPLTMTGVAPLTTTHAAAGIALNQSFPITLRYSIRWDVTCDVEGRSDQGGWFDNVVVMNFTGGLKTVEQSMVPILEWCTEQWGEAGPEPALWRHDDNIIHLRESCMMVELRLRWQGVTV